MKISALNVVLVRTQYSGNIGAAARALANMGGSRLILIEPQCEIDEAARQGASGAQDWLERTVVYPTWSHFYAQEPEGFRIALSRRSGKNRPSEELNEVLNQIKEQAPTEASAQPLYLFFGPEASGLSADDTAWSHRTASLPTPGSFKSLNLAQAVLLSLFITQQNLGFSGKPVKKPKSKSNRTHQGPPTFPDESIRKWLEAMGSSLEKRRKSAYLTLRRLLLQNWPTPNELMVLQAILEQNIRKLRAKNKARENTKE